MAPTEDARPEPSPAAGEAPPPSRRRAAWIVAAWLAVCAVAFVSGRLRLAPSSGLFDHLPEAHRPEADVAWLLAHLPANTDLETARALEARLVETFEAEHAPLAPTRADLEAFADAHRLYFATPEDLAALDEGTRPERIERAVDDLHALLASPVFGTISDAVRADPLGLGPSLPTPSPVAGTLRDVRVTRLGNFATTAGDRLLLRLSTDEAPATIRARAEAAVAQEGVRIDVLGRRALEDAAAKGLRRRALRVLGIAASIWIAAATLALRRAGPVLALVACLSVSAVALLPWVGALDLWSVPALLFAMAFAAEAALPSWRRTGGGWTATAILAAAPAPLLLSSHPALAAFTVHFTAAFLVLGVALRWVLPALAALVGREPVWPRTGFRVVPMPVFGVLATAGLLVAAAAAARRAPVVEPDRLARVRLPITRTERAMATGFFDPDRLVRAEARAPTAAAALAEAGEDARALATLVPSEADLLVAPGRLTLPSDEAERIRRRIEALDLPRRFDALAAALDARGFPPEAFGAFLSLATTLTAPPSPQATLDGPMGRWIERLAERNPDGTVAIPSFVLLSPDPDVLPDRVLRGDGRTVRLVGPAVARRRSRRHFDDWLGTSAVASLWLSALLVFVGTRKLTVAFGAALAGLAAQGAVIGSMALVGLPLGVHLAPVLLLVGASAAIAATRAMEIRAGHGRIAPELPLLTSTFQVGAGLALLAAGQPLWAHEGAALAVGAAAAWGVGLFAAPGVHVVLLRIRRRT